MSISETEQLTKMIMSSAVSRALSAVAELGIADQIEKGKPRRVEELAKATSAHEPSLYRVLRFLASQGVFEEKAARAFDHTPLSERLRSDAKDSFLAAARMFHVMAPAFDGLHHSVLTGRPAFEKVFGVPVFEYMGAHPELASTFDAAMTAIHGHETGAMIDAYDFEGIDVLADVGGGNGTLLAAVLRRHPRMRGILFDQPHVLTRARGTMSAEDLEGRCTLVEGNFFESIPKGADGYLMRHIIHDWTDEQSVGILQHCRKAIPSNGRC